MQEPAAETLLPALLEVFHGRGADRLPTEEIVAALGERGWVITATKLTRTLKPAGVPLRQYRVRGERERGYLLADIAAAQGAGPTAEIRDTAPTRKAQGAGLADEGRDAPSPPPPLPAAPTPRVMIDAIDQPDPAQEWAWRLALAAAWR